MSTLKSLAKDTAIYGLSSIVARFVNYLLVPIQTARFTAEGGQYGVITNVYAYTALLIIILTYGMETTFFRFMNKEGENPRRVYSTTLRMVGATSALFCAMVVLFRNQIASLMGYGDHPEYVWVLFVTVAIDAFSAILFAYLRCIHRPVKFASLKIINILMNVTLNVLYLIVLPALKLNPFGIYDGNFRLDVAWVFYINMFCTVATLLMLCKELRGITAGFDGGICRRMLGYTWPILVMGLAGQLNQCVSQIIFPYLYDGTPQEAGTQLGIYGACIKIAMIMVMITQAFRFAYEPFVFGKAKDSDNRTTYATAMKYYVIFTLLAFLCVMGYIGVLRYIVGPSYWPGLRVVPIVMAAEIMFGVFFNLSFWYKLTDRTIWGSVVLRHRMRNPRGHGHNAHTAHGLYGLRMGRLRRLRNINAHILLCRPALLSDSLSRGHNPILRGPGCRTFRRHQHIKRLAAAARRHRGEHAADPHLRRSHRPPRLPALLTASHRPTLQEEMRFLPLIP